MAARNFPNWIDAYLAYCQGQESPRDFHFWAAVVALSSTLGHHVYMPRQVYSLWPNLFVILVAKSSLLRKSTAVKIATSILKRAETPIAIYSQAITAPALVKYMIEKGKLDMLDPEKALHSNVLIASDELINTLGTDALSSGMMGHLTGIYDCWDKTYEYTTISRGTETIDDPCLNMLAATTIEWFRACIPRAAAGGFGARIIFVYKEDRERCIPDPYITEGHATHALKLAQDLDFISMLRGEVRRTPEAVRVYSDWYKSITSDGGVLDSFHARKHDTTLKVAMALSVARRDDLVIDEACMRQAIEEMTKQEQGMASALERSGSTDMGDDTDRMLRLIQKRGEVAHSIISKSVWRYMDSEAVKRAAQTLSEAGLIEIVHRRKGGILYKAL